MAAPVMLAIIAWLCEDGIPLLAEKEHQSVEVIIAQAIEIKVEIGLSPKSTIVSIVSHTLVVKRLTIKRPEKLQKAAKTMALFGEIDFVETAVVTVFGASDAPFEYMSHSISPIITTKTGLFTTNCAIFSIERSIIIVSP